ncbi:MAG: transposase [Candidatus Binatia bacterium]
MARPLRIEYPGAFYHVTSRGNDRRAVFRDDGDREKFIALLGQGVDQFQLRLHVYVLMDNHYHLLVETVLGQLSRAIRYLNGVYTQSFNRRHSRVGHLFQGRYKAILIEKESYLLELSRYIHLNPWRVLRSQDPFGYAWSSLKAYAGLSSVPGWLTVKEVLASFGGGGKRAYRDFVREGMESGVKTPWDEVRGQALLGSEGFVSGVVDRYLREVEEKGVEVSGIRELGRFMEADKVLREVSRYYGVNKEDLRRRSQVFTEPRYVASYFLRRMCLLSLIEIGEKVGLHYSAVSNAIRHVEKSPTRPLMKSLREIEQKINN